jgi:hypothetical protein
LLPATVSCKDQVQSGNVARNEQIIKNQVNQSTFSKKNPFEARLNEKD